MKKSLKTVFVLLGIGALVVIPLLSVNADVVSPDIPGVPKSKIDTESKVLGILKSVISMVYTVFFILAILFVLLAAYQYLTSGGDSKKVEEAKTKIIYAAVAIAVALIATGFSSIIKGFVEKSG